MEIFAYFGKTVSIYQGVELTRCSSRLFFLLNIIPEFAARESHKYRIFLNHNQKTKDKRSLRINPSNANISGLIPRHVTSPTVILLARLTDLSGS